VPSSRVLPAGLLHPSARAALAGGVGGPLKYRPEIDGLRALAVLPVVLFHAGIPGFSGGYVGVDVFFVISGYLITSIVLVSLASERFSFPRFYERRARRILPALFVVMLACIPFAWALLTPGQLADFTRSLASTTLFSSNFLFWSEDGYFDAAAELKPLLHTWSLSIEEQFYLLFPLWIAFLWRRARAYLGHVLAAVAVLSIALAGYQSGGHPQAAFFLLPSRAWELLLGAWLAHREHTSPLPVPPGRMAPAAALAGMLMILGAVIVFDHATPCPGLLTLLPTIGTALILLYGGARGPAQAILSKRVLVGCGLMSYSLYLWHQPVYAFARARATQEITLAHYGLLIAVSIALAWLTWRFVETPFRSRNAISVRRLWQGVSGAGALILAFAGIGIASHGFPTRFAAKELEILAVKEHVRPQLEAEGKRCSNRWPDEACVFGEPGVAPTWALVGDSHAAALRETVDAGLRERNLAGLELTRSGCLYLPGFRVLDGRTCKDWSARVRQRLLAPSVQNVVLAGRYVMQLQRSRFDNGEGGRESGEPGGLLPVDGPPLDEAAGRTSVIAGYQQSIRELLSVGKNVYLVYPIPEVGWDVPDQLFKLRVIRQSDAAVTTSHAGFLQRAAGVLEAFDALGNAPGLLRVRPHAWLCNSAVAGRCATELDGQILYSDDDHPSLAGATLIANEILATVGPRPDPTD
jgi:peptidoglycan/LPS O-acetylase OafA/YrhL